MAKKFTTGADFAGQKLINLGDGSNASDAVTLGQLQAAIRGLVWKPEVKAATTTNITLSGLQTIDGIAIAAGDRVLVKDQTTASANGIYVAGSSTWARAADLDEAAEFTNGVAVTVEQGTVSADRAYVMSTDGAITVGTSSISFVMLGGTGTSYTGSNSINISSGVISAIVKSGGGLLIDGQGLYIDPTFAGLAKRYAIDAATTATTTVTHNLNTLDVVVQVVQKANGEVVEADVLITGVNTVTVTFATAPTTGQYRIVVVG